MFEREIGIFLRYASIPIINGAVSTFLSDAGRGSGTTPKAYINWILFDENFKYVAGNFSRVGSANTVKDHYSELSNIEITKNGYLYVYCSNESPVAVFFDNLQVIHTHGRILEETHYYPFGLTMAGISSQALGIGKENKKKYNGIEWQNDLGLNEYDANFRELDPQIGRWWEIDPKIESMEHWSPYASNYDNPITYSDPLGDEPDEADGDPPTKGGIVGFIKGFFGGAGDGAKSTLEGAASQVNGVIEAITNPSIDGLARLSPMGMLMGGSPKDVINSVVGAYETGARLGKELKSGDASQAGHAVGFLVEKVAELYVLKKVAGAERGGAVIAEESGGAKGSLYSNLQDSKSVGPGKNFTPTQKQAILQENMKRNGGVIKSDASGKILDKPVQSQKGIKANMNQAEIDHVNAKSKGGSNSYSNAQVLSKEENLKKRNQ